MTQDRRRSHRRGPRRPGHDARGDGVMRPIPTRKTPTNPGCSIECCGRSVYARGWCMKHYQRWNHHGDPLALRPNQKPLIALLLARMEVNPDGCWIVTGRRDNAGYSVVGKPSRRGHRVSYEHFVGPIPEGLHIDHLCHSYSDCPGGDRCPHRPCINPDHLEPVTTQENIRRGLLARQRAAVGAERRSLAAFLVRSEGEVRNAR